MASKKQQQQQQQQEMVQVDRTSSASPFWKTTSNTSSSSQNKKIIGASYSHADILNFSSLSLSKTNSRPQTPPSTNHSRESSAAPARTSSTTSPRPTKHNYSSFLRDTHQDWNDEEGDGDIMFEDDEDEFGLPSIANMRRKGRRKQPSIGKDAGGSSGRNSLGSTAWRAIDSGDIAEERGVPNYPTAKKLEGKILRPQYQEILRDPANSLHLISHSPVPTNASAKQIEEHSARTTRINKFKRILQASTISLSELRDSAWSGVPSEVRAMTWQILLGYLPTSSERRVATLERKRREYLDGVRQAFERAGTGAISSTNRGRARGLDEAIWHQISIDVPRTNPHLELYSYEATQRSLERILYLWAIRHPASGYVQGINDLVTPFWQVFLGAYISDPDIEFGMDPGQLPKQVLDAVEADSFWCLTKLLDGIQDNYIAQQPGIQRQVASLRDLTTRIDDGLAKHLQNEGVEFIQFSFRWMNCLLMREISVKNTIRMWDTYLAEEDGFSSFHLYVCAAFLVKWSDQLRKMDFQEVMMFLQALPTRQWTEKDIELLLSEAFIWQSLFRGSSAHLKNTGSSSGGVGMGPDF
ncbi:GTPase activating protein-like protein GYP1 [Dothidotthia symphoricarpi CBS 119687]|uniref:GTPase activating protein-like protein GYP1 n=1 Tax=Dothidotthia symphoricarpi CBS 119687 TaxID=1392245 RepID=A0A6A6AWU9_9PLEO|nr:GTPase activating protein-like protein GYP1 [Dothidotthia symphoricarpi CBS 119687]KAF2135011.1 GTPase activating protein-like protein GYP1 [Dothidotthia symphoricarpi CBS 119687]